MQTVQECVEHVREKMAEACQKSGRSIEEVTLVAVTKFVPEERIAEAVAAGITHVGENRAQEFLEKEEFFEKNKLFIHFIGQLQKNKVKYVIGKVNLVQSVDRLSLAQEMQRLCAERGIQQDVLLQVNIGHEPQKGGFAPENLREACEQMQSFENLHVKGLMCIPPAVIPDEARRYFAQTREWFERAATWGIPNVEMRTLSMGMSNDFAEAILEGATMVRVVTALFGSRNVL
jgi:pyridoxal phosphate enzyme (YggS family)